MKEPLHVNVTKCFVIGGRIPLFSHLSSWNHSSHRPGEVINQVWRQLRQLSNEKSDGSLPVNLSDHGPILRQRERKWAWWQPFSNRYFVAQGTVGTVRNQPKPNCNRQIKKLPSKTHKDCISRVECKVYTTKSTLPGLEYKQGTASSLNSVMSNSPLLVKFSGLGDILWLVSEHVESGGIRWTSGNIWKIPLRLVL